MRFYFAFFAVLVILGFSPAVSRTQAQDLGNLEANVANLRQNVTQQIDDYRNKYGSYKQEVSQQNSQVDQLVSDQTVYKQRYQIYENVISLRSKDAVQKWVDAARARLGASELDGYNRLGIHNPYDPSSYIRFYDKNGDLKVSEARNSYQLLEQQRQDWEQKAKRLRDQEAKINSDSYQSALNAYKGIPSLRQQLAQAENQLAQAQYQQALNAANQSSGTSGTSGASGYSGSGGPDDPQRRYIR